MRVVITGADGFIGKNLRVALMERAGTEVLPITRDSAPRALVQAIAQADAVVHLAGVNRPQSNHEFAVGNADFTLTVCNAVRSAARPVPLLLSSSTQAKRDNLYGASKRAAENHVFSLATDAGSPVAVYSLPNVFGKWARPNYNSAVATFCHNAVHGLPLVIHDPAAVVRLVYVDDVVADFLRRLDGDWPADGRAEVAPPIANDRSRRYRTHPRTLRNLRQLPAAGSVHIRFAETRRCARSLRRDAQDS
jgi:UDP-2-acetamido-2,6-beta-L-arabino-hexul-4-ose reductase